MTIEEKAILLLAEKLETGLKDFYVGLARRDDYLIDRRWYTPAELLSSMGRVLARSSSDPTLQAAGVVIFGALHVLGIKGTVQLVLKLRRKNATKSKGSETAVPGVRSGSDSKN